MTRGGMEMVIRVTSSNTKPQTDEKPYMQTPFRVFEDFFNDWMARTARAGNSHEGYRPSVDIYEREGDLVIKADIPGVDEKAIDLKLEGNVLTIRGERKIDPETEKSTFYQVEGFYGNFSHSFRLPDSIDADKITAKCGNGVLTVTAPSKPEAQPRTIKVG
jgi:HSP20 family protein